MGSAHLIPGQLLVSKCPGTNRVSKKMVRARHVKTRRLFPHETSIDCHDQGETLPRNDSANRLMEHCSGAGLALANPFPGNAGRRWLPRPLRVTRHADTMRSFWPQLVEMGIVTEEGIPAATLATRQPDRVSGARTRI
jgi:hypothetical protein